jgi:hypothetical protein
MRRAGVAVTVAAGLMAMPAVAQAAPVALWHMDETGGTTMADSVGTNVGTLVNVTVGVPGGVTGTAYHFDGADSYVSVPDSPALDPGTADIAFTAYVRYTVTPPTGSTTDYDILRKGTASDSAQFYKMEIRSDNRAVCRFVGSKTSKTGIIIHTGPQLNDGNWHSITCVKLSTKVQMIVDGRTYTKSGRVGSISNSGALTLGAKPVNGFSDFYNGDLDEVSVSIG